MLLEVLLKACVQVAAGMVYYNTMSGTTVRSRSRPSHMPNLGQQGLKISCEADRTDTGVKSGAGETHQHGHCRAKSQHISLFSASTTLIMDCCSF